MWDYTDKVLDHFHNPRNVGKIDNPDGVGQVGALACGDALTLMFKLDENKRIVDAKFQTFGCASAIASSSALTEMIKGMTLEEAKKVTNQDIAEFLGGLPEQKMHCSVMGREALEAAIHNYETGETTTRSISDDPVICHCFDVHESEIVRVVRFPGWQQTTAGEREVQKALRRTLLKYQLHRDQDLFDRAYGYIRQYY